jgi:hypothetical protein
MHEYYAVTTPRPDPVRHMPMRTASSTLGGRRNAAFSSAIASTVVYFGYPRAYEDEAERSARAGPAQSARL